ncbi:uncharacterized protein PHACADRAFT_246188 [Phanerochaete carnosa HHB-10118-sp]|uniref:Heterokaryon incompatibility domain-containing protein n=1 Tax=Phanerochaete carnosa (strain HHB-10118-sp) TaxID=650164 RepID=K5VBQ0_PHACS|nr:uncharacterized protein PHACADRAFT_246188 [Phanerochaete carnosa HHB-10118-sp]EKM60326.1 hypothetical protein PHACADRAFT_246188 [Phanerochaete carnosa HHB-10118-sp]
MPTPAAPLIRDRPSRVRHFVLKGTSVRIRGYDVPWEKNDVGKIPVFYGGLLGPPTESWMLYRDQREWRRSAWGLAQIALLGAAAEEKLFQTSGQGERFTLRPTTRSSVPFQWVHVGPGAIPDTLADLSCATMSIADLLHNLNTVLGANHLLGTEGIDDLLEEIRRTSHDFGEAYGKVRAWWTGPELGRMGRRLYAMLREHEADDEAFRQQVTQGFALQKSGVRPRRVWDLYSNRVLPTATVPEYKYDRSPRSLPYQLWTVSHSWVAEEEQENIWTPVNNNQWPVPLPRATSLGHVRVELLNMGAEYVWLDVLCLRQQGRKEDEAQRIEEWKIDVPTIGYIYQGDPDDKRRPCITYFNGLGLPLDTSPNTLASGRHWFNRVWTRQETLLSWLPGGLTGEPLTDGEEFFSRLRALTEQADAQSEGLAKELMGRSCTKELDRIAGLAYCLRCPTLPLYNEAVPVERAWELLLKHVPDGWRTDVFLRNPADTPFALFPSWRGYGTAGPALYGTLLDGLNPLQLVDQSQLYTGDPGQYYHIADFVGPCRITCTSHSTTTENWPPGALRLRLDVKGASTFTLVPEGIHGVVLQDAVYTLIRFRGYYREEECWVIAEIIEDRDARGFERPAVKAVKWAVMRIIPDYRSKSSRKTNWTPVDYWAKVWRNSKQGNVMYITGEEAQQRTKYKDQYIAAFEKIRALGKTFIIT